MKFIKESFHCRDLICRSELSPKIVGQTIATSDNYSQPPAEITD
jgi:hypothetical protein